MPSYTFVDIDGMMDPGVFPIDAPTGKAAKDARRLHGAWAAAAEEVEKLVSDEHSAVRALRALEDSPGDAETYAERRAAARAKVEDFPWHARQREAHGALAAAFAAYRGYVAENLHAIVSDAALVKVADVTAAKLDRARRDLEEARIEWFRLREASEALLRRAGGFNDRLPTYPLPPADRVMVPTARALEELSRLSPAPSPLPSRARQAVVVGDVDPETLGKFSDEAKTAMRQGHVH